MPPSTVGIDMPAPEFLSVRPSLFRLLSGEHAMVAASFGIAIFYATIRYNFFKGTPIADWPTYTVNKALGFSSLILVALTVKRWSASQASRTLMLWSGIFAGGHAILSLILLTPDYYPKFFDGLKLTGIASLSLLFGAGATVLQEIGARQGHDWRAVTRRKALCLLIALTGIHAALPGISGWFAPAGWPGGLPPITLISAMIATFAIGWSVAKDRRPPQP